MGKLVQCPHASATSLLWGMRRIIVSHQSMTADAQVVNNYQLWAVDTGMCTVG